jgi:TonB-dependent starch-binding outer membrane protein SusC
MKSVLNWIKYLSGLSLIVLFCNQGLAQVNVTGVISDALLGETLVGATVRIQGTTLGTVTDIDGRYSILVGDDDAILVYSYVGYQDHEEVVDGRAVINVALQPSIETLSEMVVIGYGMVRKDDLTGSVSVISSADLNRVPSTSFTKAIQGRASGVVVSQSGSPGVEAQIRVRGVGSINQDPNPIYVIDGVITNSISAVNPNDIESIQVLKDASAAAIYGADGANGVIIITTKRGEKGVPRVNYSSFASINRVPRQFDVMNADEYSSFYGTLLENANILVPVAYTDPFRQWYFGDGWQQGTNWQNEVSRTGIGHNHNLRISGGGDESNFSISGNYYAEDGVLRASAAERFNFRVNSDFDLGKYVKVGESFSITRSSIQNPSAWQGNPWQVTLITSPLMRMHNDQNKGGFEGPQISYEFPDPENPGDSLIVINTGFNDKPNPRGPIEIGDFRTYNTNLLANIYVEIKPFPWLTFKTTPSIDASFIRVKNWFPAFDLGVRSRGQAQLNESFYEGINLSLENQITFSNSYQGHSIVATAVHHVRRNRGNDLLVEAFGFPYENLNTVSMSFASGRETNGGYYPFSSESYLGRVIYDYNRKYLLTASLRYDGNSRFGPENRWGAFPSASVAWKVNDDFLQGVEEISILKVRAGWGKTGNSAIGLFEYQSLMDGFEQFSPVFGVGHNMLPALNVVHSFGNPALRWEAAQMINIGVDLNLLYDKVQFSADYYIKDQNDLLVKVPVSSAHGRNYQGEAGETTAGDPWINLAEIQNKGLEFTGLYRKMEGNFNYVFSANLTTINNKVKYVPEDVLTANNLTKIGNTIGSFYGYVAERIITPADFDENGNYLYAAPATGKPSPGDLMFKDLNNDGIINDLDRTIIGKAVPDLTYSFNMELYYMGWDFSAFFYGMHNYQVYNHLRAGIEGFSSQDMGHNKLRDFALNYYREDRPSEQYIRADMNNSNQNDRPSTWYLEQASFFRLKDIQLGYSLPGRTAGVLGLSRARFYASASNLFTMTSYTGRDPEAPTVSQPLTPGNDNGTYPVPRIFTLGIQVDI